MVDGLGDHPNQVDKSPYAYAWNNPVNLTDLDGNCPVCPIIVWQAVRYVGTAIVAGAVTYTVVKGYKDYKSRQTSVQDNTSVSLDLKNGPVLLKTEDKSASETKEKKSPNPDGSKGKPDH